MSSDLILKSERIESDIQIELADPSTLTVKLISVIPGSKRECVLIGHRHLTLNEHLMSI